MGNYVFPDFDDKNLVYFDDIVVFGDTFEEYLHNLEVTLNRLIEVGMVLRPNKCSFASESVEYCGFLINQHEYRVKPDRVEAINNFYKPKTVKQLRR